MLSTFFQPCEVKLHLLQNVIFVHPPKAHPLPDVHDERPTSEDELVRGLVELRVPSDRHIGGIRVRLRGSEMIAILDTPTSVPIGWDERVILNKSLEIGVPSARSARSRSRAGASGTRSRASSQAPSRDPSRSASRAGSPGRHASRRDSSDSGAEDRGRSSSRTASRTRRDLSVGSGLAGALAAAMRGRSSTRATHGSRSTSKVSRPSSPGPTPWSSSQTVPRSLSSHPHPLPVSALMSSHTVPGRQSMSPLPPQDDHDNDELFRGRTYFRPALAHEELELQHHLNPSPSTSSLRSPSASLFGRGASLSRPVEEVHLGPSHSAIEDTQDGTEDSQALEEGMFLAKGVHGFEFAFILPSSCAPYERSAYGRVRYMIRATVVGGGRAKSNVDTMREIFPMAVPSVESPSTPLTVLHHDWHPSLGGALSVACTANNISVGGIFNIDIHSPDSPQDLIVYQVRVSLETQVDLYTSKKGKQTARMRPVRLFEKGNAPKRPADMESQRTRDASVRWTGTHDSWSVQGIARVPDDNVTRPTTLPGSKADIRFSHQLLVEVIHSRDPALGEHTTEMERKLKVYALRQSVVIPSCCVAFSAVTLPLYEEKDPAATTMANMYRVPEALTGEGLLPTQSPWSVAAAPLRASGHEQCVCGMSLADLEAKERNMLPRNPEYDVPVNEVRSRGKIGEYAPVDDSTLMRSSAGACVTAPVTAPGFTSNAPPANTTPTASPPLSRAPSHDHRPMLHSASTPVVRSTRHPPPLPADPAPHIRDAQTDYLVARSARTHDNLTATPYRGLPMAPTPSESGQTTPVPIRSRSHSRARVAPRDLSEAIPRLNALRETAEQDTARCVPPPPSGQPPAYDTLDQ